MRRFGAVLLSPSSLTFKYRSPPQRYEVADARVRKPGRCGGRNCPLSTRSPFPHAGHSSNSSYDVWSSNGIQEKRQGTNECNRGSETDIPQTERRRKLSRESLIRGWVVWVTGQSDDELCECLSFPGIVLLFRGAKLAFPRRLHARRNLRCRAWPARRPSSQPATPGNSGYKGAGSERTLRIVKGSRRTAQRQTSFSVESRLFTKALLAGSGGAAADAPCRPRHGDVVGVTARRLS